MLKNLQELYQYRALLYSLVVRELKARYRNSVLGFLWTFLNPMLHMAVYSLMFGFIMPNGIPKYPYFLFVGLLPWIYFNTSLSAGASAVSDRRDLLTKVRFPAQVLPTTVVLTNLVNYLFSLPLMVGLGILYGVYPTWHALFFVFILLVQTIFILALTYMLSALNVAFRDLQHIVGNLLMLGFFLTPVLWTVKSRPPQQQELILMTNPMAAITDAYRSIFYLQELPSAKPLLAVLGISVVLLWVGSAIFDRRREEFAELA